MIKLGIDHDKPDILIQGRDVSEFSADASIYKDRIVGIDPA